MDKSVLIPAISAIIGGLIVGVVAPFVKGYLEMKKIKRDDRKFLIGNIRFHLQQEIPFDSDKFIKTIYYSQLKPHLSEKLIHKIEWRTNQVTIVIGHKRDDIVYEILDEITLLEKKWNLI